MSKERLMLITGIIFLGVASYKFINKPAPPPAMPAASSRPQAVSAQTPAVPKPAAPLLTPQEIQKVMDAARDSDSDIRRGAAKLLIQLHTAQADRALFAMIVEDTDPSIRQNIIISMAGRRDSGFSRSLARALQDIEPSVRIAAIQGLTKTGDASNTRVIAQMLQDVDQGVRLQALNSLDELQKQKENKP